ncbi:MAG: 2-amino-4-hydroxy-6-hydroxymethyldihydropteridine diphosphokinase [Cuspidothrix sp.]
MNKNTIFASQAAIALGSNMGDCQTILTEALTVLNQTPGITIQAQSSWYQTKAIGPTQPDYLNGCATLLVEISPQALLENLLAIEQQFGRVRQEHWGPRTLDLDLLLYDDLILHQPNLQVPHPRLAERAFVLVPLAEIAPNWPDPISKRMIQELVLQVDTCNVHLL